MTDHAAVRAGDEAETAYLLLRLARQAVSRRSFPSPSGRSAWTDTEVGDLVAEVYDRKEQFVEVAIATTVTANRLELYLLTAIENVLRDQSRETERGKLIERLKTILGQEPQFLRHTTPYNAWRLDGAPDVAWQGDIGHLVRAALKLRGVAVTDWNTAGKTPKATRDAIIRVSETALDEAAGYVRDPDVALVVQTCIPAVPLEERDIERSTPADDPTAFEEVTSPADLSEPDEPTAEEIADAVWSTLTHDERRAVPHLSSARGVGDALGLPRRAAATVTDSAKTTIRMATTPGLEAAVVADLVERSHALGTDPGTDPEGQLP